MVVVRPAKMIVAPQPSGFHRIRHYGLLANGSRKASLARARQLLHATPEAHAQIHDTDAEISAAQPCFVCPHCGGSMIILQTFMRGQTIRAPPQHTPAP
jgi:hypothetical protein